jgi:hypothetical protein
MAAPATVTMGHPETVKKISSAVRRSKLATSKGNFWLKIRDNGSFHLEQLD